MENVESFHSRVPFATFEATIPTGAINPKSPTRAAMCMPILRFFSCSEMSEKMSRGIAQNAGMRAVILFGSASA